MQNEASSYIAICSFPFLFQRNLKYFVFAQVDLSQIYGQKLSRVLALRLMKDGKLKYSTFNGEMYPPFLNQTEVPMFESKRIPKDYRFATGHPVFPSVPMNLYFATIWLR